MAKQIFVDENGNEHLVSGTINTAEMLPYDSNTNTKAKIDSKADISITCRRIQTTLTFNSTLNRFTLPSGTPPPAQAQQCIVARNSSTGAIYALWYVSTDQNFQIGATLAGTAPTNNQTCYVNYVIPNT